MKIYLGVGGSKKVHEFAARHGCSWLLTPTNARTPPSGSYALDNGAFVAWKNHVDWNESRFMSLIRRYPDYDFVVAPDIVCGGGAVSHALA